MAVDFCVKTARKSSSVEWGISNMVKRRRITRDWRELQCDVLQQILSRLNFIDILQAKSVCRSWYSATKSLQSCRPRHVVPLLFIPPQHDEEEDEKARNCCWLVSPDGTEVYKDKENMPEEIWTSSCIGSSHGWMIFLDEKIAPFLLNPLTGSRIEFPRLDPFMGIERIRRDNEGGSVFHVDHVNGRDRCSTTTKLLQILIRKAILTANPREDNNFGMVLICSRNKKLAFCGYRDDCWTDLCCKHGPYMDIMCHENQLYAVNQSGSVVEVWEIGRHCFPENKVTIEIPFPGRSLRTSNYFGDRSAMNYYLAESCGEILLLVRFIGELVDGYGRMLREEDLLTHESNHPLVCPYQTRLFHLYKLDIKYKKWLDVKSLHDRVLFLGGNHSISISSCDLVGSEGNSIYFTDDYWGRMEEDYLYGGHDIGEFDLEDESVYSFYEPVTLKILPPAYWILPNPF